jgi:uncharacterized membrane protein (DUF2068 family)
LTPTEKQPSTHATAKKRGVRFIAAFEACKGLVVLAVGFGLLHFLHRDIQATAEELVHHSHLNPAKHYPHIFLEAMAKVNDSRLWLLACLAFTYATVRLIEAWGLWRLRPWAEWFAIVSGGIYVPFEIIELVRHVTLLRVMILIVNLFIVAYLIYIRSSSRKEPQSAPSDSPMATIS